MRGIGGGKIAAACLMAGVLAIAFLARSQAVLAFDSGAAEQGAARVTEELREEVQEQNEVERERRERQMREQIESLEEMQEESEKERLGIALILLLGGLALAIMVALSLKNIRRKVLALVKELGQSMQAQGGGERSWLGTRKRTSRRGLVVSGFDGSGNRIRIVLSSGRFAEQRLGISFGRDPALVDEVVNDPSMSSRHLRISLARGGECHVEDLNSKNGTILDGRKLQPFQAEPVGYNSTLTAGDVELTLSER